MGLQLPGAMRLTTLVSLLILSTPAFAQSAPALAQPTPALAGSTPAFAGSTPPLALVPARPILLVDSGASRDAAVKMQVRGAFFMGAGIVHLAAQHHRHRLRHRHRPLPAPMLVADPLLRRLGAEPGGGQHHLCAGSHLHHRRHPDVHRRHHPAAQDEGCARSSTAAARESRSEKATWGAACCASCRRARCARLCGCTATHTTRLPAPRPASGCRGAGRAESPG